MTQTPPASAGTRGPRNALRCQPLPPLDARGVHPVATSVRRPAGLSMLRRGLAVLAALALPALGAPLAEPVHRARPPWATQAAAVPQTPLDGTAAANPEVRARFVPAAFSSKVEP